MIMVNRALFICIFFAWLLALFSCNEPSKSPAGTITTDSIDKASKLIPPKVDDLSTSDTIKTVYLTFDDGPLNGTQAIIEVINKEQLPVTMFMVGKNMELNAQTKSNFDLAYHDEFLEVGNHSYSHANNHYKEYYDSPAVVLQDFDKNQALLKFKDKDARMPGRNTWRVADRKKDDAAANGSAAADLLKKSGYTLFGWDLEWQHHSNGVPVQKVQEMFEAIEKTIADPKRCFTPYHFVLLSHDEMFQKSWEESELRQLIGLLKSKGYKFDHIDNYPRQ